MPAENAAATLDTTLWLSAPSDRCQACSNERKPPQTPSSFHYSWSAFDRTRTATWRTQSVAQANRPRALSRQPRNDIRQAEIAAHGQSASLAPLECACA
ncbi:hypothetical protein RSOL_400410, partial [Rhizoctonia solani AG-3 Rhs1AP]